jgi:hypothetical protein
MSKELAGPLGRSGREIARLEYPTTGKIPGPRRSIKVDFPGGPSDGLILGFPEGFLKLPFEELRLNSLLFRAMPEVGFSLGCFPPKQLVGTS